jgi:hypothetical protein
MLNFHFHVSLKLSQGEVHDFSGEVQNNLRAPHLPLKSGHDFIRWLQTKTVKKIIPILPAARKLLSILDF